MSARRTIDPATSWFPGPWLGGLSLVIAPLLMFVGVLLRVRFHFFFPDQLEAYHQHPALLSASYGTFLAGNLLLWPAICTVARSIAAMRPAWAKWGGCLVLFGILARMFHYGANAFVFSIAGSQGVDAAEHAVGTYYSTPEFVVSSISLCIVSGWVVLAIGCYLSGTLGLVPSIALAMMFNLMIGVVKGTNWLSVVAVTGLLIALVPLGIRTLRNAPRIDRRTALTTVPAAVLFVVASVVMGQLG